MPLSDVLQSLRLIQTQPGSGLAELYQTWRGHLGACLPRRLRPWLLGHDRRLLVLPQGDEAQVILADDDERRPLGGLTLGSDEPLPVPGPRTKGRSEQTLIVLPAGDVLRRSLSFPAQVRDNLQQVVRYEIDRLTPFQADQVLFDTALSGSSQRGDRILVELALCRRDRVEPWLQRLREAGSPVDQVTWEEAWPKANLLPLDLRPRRNPGPLQWGLALAAMVLLLGTAALITPLWQRGEVLALLQVEVARARTAAQEVDKLREDLERARQGSVAVLQRKEEQPRMIDLMRELTAQLPDGTWIQNLNLDKGEVQLRGESTQATALIALLEKAAGVQGVTFASPVTQVAQTGAERFNISFQYARPKEP